MNKLIIFVYIILIVPLILVSCTNTFEDMNHECNDTNISFDIKNDINDNKENSEENTSCNNKLPDLTPKLNETNIYCEEINWEAYEEFNRWWSIDSNRLINSSASSTLDCQGDFTYFASNAHDFNLDTAWVEGNEGDGVGENLEFFIDKTDNCTISHIDIINGYVNSNYLWINNSRVKKLRMWVNNKPFAILNVEDSKKVQTFKVPEIQLDENVKVKFEIMDIYQGEKYQDVAITEIQFRGNTKENNSLILIEQGTFEVTMTLDDGNEGIFTSIVQDHLTLNFKFTTPANRESVEVAFQKDVSDFYSYDDCDIVFDWIDNNTLTIYLSNLNLEDNYEVHLPEAKDIYGFYYTQVGAWADGFNLFSSAKQNKIVKMNINSKQIVDDINISFPNILYFPASVSPYSDCYTYNDHYDSHPMCHGIFKPMIYNKDNEWIEINNNKIYDEIRNDELIWLNNELVFIKNDIFNTKGKLIKTLELEGNIVGIKTSYDRNKIAVFASKINEPLKLYIFDQNFSNLLTVITMPFTYSYYHECNQVYINNINFTWLDDKSILVTGWNNQNILTQYDYGKPDIYKVNIENKSINLEIENARLLKHNNNGQIIIQTCSFNGEKYDYTDYLVIDLENKTKEKLSFIESILNNNLYFYKNIIVYLKDNSIYFYDIDSKSEHIRDFDNYDSILGIKENEIYLNIRE